jgi:hypothetical protein
LNGTVHVDVCADDDETLYSFDSRCGRVGRIRMIEKGSLQEVATHAKRRPSTYGLGLNLDGREWGCIHNENVIRLNHASLYWNHPFGKYAW